MNLNLKLYLELCGVHLREPVETISSQNNIYDIRYNSDFPYNSTFGAYILEIKQKNYGFQARLDYITWSYVKTVCKSIVS